MTELNHEPETKSTNKARDLQDAIIRARKAGYSDPLAVARKIHDWFMEATYEIQITVLAYAITHLWSVVTGKMSESESTAAIRPRSKSKLSPEQKARIEAETWAELDRKWLSTIIPMTGGQARAAKKLPDNMLDKVGEDQRIGDVFSPEEILKVPH
jgi:hypothetical protein